MLCTSAQLCCTGAKGSHARPSSQTGASFEHCRGAQLARYPAVTGSLHRQALTQERYNWEKQWYPVAITADLDPSRPRAITLLGQRLVLWRAKDGSWQCFDDRCPHRLAPLSGVLP